LEAADRHTDGPTGAVVARGKSGSEEVQEVAVAIGNWRNCGRKPIVTVDANVDEITVTAAPVPGSRKKRPLE